MQPSIVCYFADRGRHQTAQIPPNTPSQNNPVSILKSPTEKTSTVQLSSIDTFFKVMLEKIDKID